MKVINLIVICVMFVFQLGAQTLPLKFHKDKTFKIVQFTDVHYCYSKQDTSQLALDCINSVLDAEKPDLVIVTGDLIFSPPAIPGLAKVLEPIIKHNVPYAIAWGNHDHEQGTPQAELQQYVEKQKNNVGKTAQGIPGNSNFALSIKSATGNNDAAVIYCFDSHDYSTLPQIKGYGWILPEQIDWYKKESKAFTTANGGTPLPSYAFFHIPLPEYNLAAGNENIRMIGHRWEKSCAPELNTGLYTAMLEAKDVVATFVGHDHDDDYVVDYNGIMLTYGRFTGGKTVYNNLPEGNGGRVIVLKEGSRTFNTWVRLRTGEVIEKIDTQAYIKK
jgi:3',5'-cyclic AMP phosphodiesterase CpdA